MGTDIHTIFQANKDNQWYDIPHNYNENRHYSLFAWLAGVRQGNTYIKPISEPRGLPSDFKINGDMGDHSFSWLLGSEILAAKPPPVAKQGIVSVEFYHIWDKISPPDTYCADVGGSNVHIVIPDVVDYYKETATHVRVCWVANLEQEFKYFIDEIRRLMEIHGEIRMVFGFDS